ncbi:MerR family transcriptional regulator [Yinghuangia seranimata]|uniref:MerR family transcriptional regulator n=1 Tax=Yinghuangia seranimata TaxID=408067 RepID=UPI00248CCA67|nr:MerR family transcriptional regulator [Yinghuangia seranimata]MDI2130738.1 MerR family transcriptional regulator [Yinghuangia seranimata]
MKIGDLAQATGVNPRLLRYYEQQGLITAERSPAGHRRYRPETVAQVGRIRLLLAAGIPTAVIIDVLPCFEGESLNACTAVHLQGQLADIEGRISRLEQSRAALRGLLDATSATPVAA